VEPVLRECHRVLVDGGRIAVNIANMVRAPGIDQTNFCTPWGMMMAPAIWRTLTDIGFLPRDQVMWSKTGEPEDMPTTTAWGSWCSASNPVLRAIAEPIFIASKGSYAREKGRSDVTASEFKRWTRNLWSIQTDRHVDHPAPFPEELPRRLIKLYSYVGDTVLDPFCGSGTTVKVARDLRRNAIGVELSERYCRIAAGRCAQTMLPLMETA
jgi:site-specific DNA-methyltransferase (adenine-specific)